MKIIFYIGTQTRALSQDASNKLAQFYHRHGTNPKWSKVGQAECEVRKLSNTSMFSSKSAGKKVSQII